MGIFKDSFDKLKKEYHERNEKAKANKAIYKEEYELHKQRGMIARARAEGFKAGRAHPPGIGGALDQIFGEPSKSKERQGDPFGFSSDLGSSDPFGFGSPSRKKKRKK